MRVEIKRNKNKFNEFKVNMVLTEGAILALSYALQTHEKNGSAIAADLINFLHAEMVKNGIEP